ncbi:MAG: universal stress protein, partial [Blastocatellia bacterium]|nr:universal stress protein [Blastocatellia bacterium]
NLLVGYDFSEYADLALSYALLFAKDYGANVYILHVVPRIAEATSAYPTTYNHAYKKLQTILPADTKSTYKTEFLVSEGPPYREILIQAEEKNIDMVFMGTRGADFGMKAIFGSNVDRVIRLSPCPVFIARPLKWN